VSGCVLKSVYEIFKIALEKKHQQRQTIAIDARFLGLKKHI